MLEYIIKRLLLAGVVIILSVTLLFLIIHFIPGDPARTMLGPRATPELIAEINLRMGLDKSLVYQIGSFLFNLTRGDLGFDIFSNRPVADIVLEQVGYTLELILASIFWSAMLGGFLGIVSAMRQNTFLDKLIAVFSVSFIAAPAFIIALYGLLFFAVYLQLFPAIGAGDGSFGDTLYHLFLPSLAMGISWVGYIARLVRASMLEVLSEKHIQNARAFGLPQNVIVYQYALRVAILPSITIIGVGMGFLLSASVFTEIIFARPGLGKLVIDSITTRNYPVVMGGVLFSTIIFVISTALSDIINAALDPRLR